MLEQVNFAVVGCGYWGINYVRVLSQLAQTNLIMACDAVEQRLDDIRQRFANVETTPYLEDVINNDKIDAVVICTPSSTHFKVAKPIIAAGKSVLIEKPMTVDSGEADALIHLAHEYGVKLMVGHIFLYNPAIEKVKSYIDRNDIGRLYYLSARRTNLGPIRTDVNVMWDLATHDVSIFNYFVNGAPDWVSAVGNRVLSDSREDVGFATLHYADGVIGHIHVSWADPNKEREVVVVGSRQRIAFNDLQTQDRVRVYEKGVAAFQKETQNFGEYQLSIRDGDIISPAIPVREPLISQVQHFVECILEDKTPLTDGYNGLDVVRTMEAIQLSMQQEGAPVRLPVFAGVRV